MNDLQGSREDLDRNGNPHVGPEFMVKTVTHQITEIFTSELNIDVSSENKDLVDTGILDSLTFVELLFHIEAKFGISVSADHLEMENFRSIARIAEFVLTFNGGGR